MGSSERLVGQKEGIVVNGMGPALQEGRQTAVLHGGANAGTHRLVHTAIRLSPAAGRYLER
jgi:hypothetical protein